MEKKQIVYKLSALYTTPQNIEIACQSRFQRITVNYTLIYDEDIPDGAQEITASDIQTALSEQDKDWLERCNLILISEFAQEHVDAQKESLKVFFEELNENIREELGIEGKKEGK